MTRLQFTGSLSLYAGLLLAFVAGGLCYWLYRQETLRSGSQWGRTLPLLRSIAVGLIVLMLTGPTVQHRYREGDPGRISILIDDSASMTLMDGESTDRFARAANGLLNADQQILKKLAESHEVSVLRGSQGSSSSLWSSTLKQSTEMPESIDAWRPVLFESSTGLGNLLSKEESSAVVLITDGQVNDGPSLEEVVRRIPAGEKPVFTIGMGKSKSLNDVSIVDIEYPDRLFRKDSLSGSFVVRETLAEGKPYTLQIVDGETIVWAETLTSQGRGQRTIAFTFPIEPITKRVAKEVPNGSGTESALAIRLQGQVLLPVRDASAASQINGEQPGVAEIKNREIQFWASMNRAKVLIVDGRSRWETRYLKNLFDRDSFWELTTVIVDPEAVMTGQPLLKRGVGRDRFPDSEELLMEYDLIILGEVPADALTIDEQAWVHRFVSELGGGLIIVDGLRNYWSEESQGKLAELLPVSREPFREGALTDVATDRSGVVVPTAMGNKLAAFQLNASGESKGSEEIVSRPANVPGEAVGLDGRRLGVWATLPKVTLAAVVKPLPGGEVLATFAAASENSSQGLIPVMVTRLNGSGRVLYSATDETWRWRYKVADEFHQRFWNQISRWIMRTPYAVQNDYVSLDAGQMNYQKGQEIEIRCRLRDSDGGPLNSSNVEAILSRPNSPDTILSLTADPILPGVYRGVATAIGDGEYRVRVSAIGLPKDAMQLSTQFVVKASESVEMQETSINSNVLRQVAEISGGQYIPENQLETLVDVLKPLSKGRIVQNELSLWQSYWWFVPVVFVLSIEWWLRKKAGLL